MKNRQRIIFKFIPLLVGIIVGVLMYKKTSKLFPLIMFSWIGASVTIGILLYTLKEKSKKQIGRKILMLLILPVFWIFFGLIAKQNNQIEELVFFISAGVISQVVIHYLIAKVIGPVMFGRSFCGWACWIGAILEWLPIKENRRIPKKLTYIRYIILVISIAIPLIFILQGYNYKYLHIDKASGKMHQFIWFAVGTGIYYLFAIILAFVFKKKRAFCKIMCPVSLIMKVPSSVSLLKRKPTGAKCIDCNKCSETCPMDIDVKSYISNGKNVKSTECITCLQCVNICPVNAIR